MPKRLLSKLIPARRGRAAPARVRQEDGLRRSQQRDKEEFRRRYAALLRHPDAVIERIDGAWRVCRLNRSHSPLDVRQENLDLVAEALSRANIPFFVVPIDSKDRYRVGVFREHIRDVARALVSAYSEMPVYVSIGQRRGWFGLVGELPDAAVDTPVRRWFVHTIYTTPKRGMILADEHAAEIEFWHRDPDLYTGPCFNAVASDIPRAYATDATCKIRGKEYPTLRAFEDARDIFEITFPIDVVYTWVDGDDPAWRAAMQRALQEEDTTDHLPAAAGTARFRSRDELRYSFRSLAMHTDFVRRIFLVTADQIPSWLDTSHRKIHIVSHERIFGGAGKLPTFNSHAIEARLHHIDGLAEHFLYFNDDVFIGRPIGPDAFFLANGMARFFPSAAPVGLGPPLPSDRTHVTTVAKNARALIDAISGRMPMKKMRHAAIPLVRSVMFEIEERFADAVSRTASSRFRSVHDVAVGSGLFPYYAFWTGRAVPATLEYKYINLSKRRDRMLSSIARERNVEVFCLNDTDMPDDLVDAADRRVARFLERYFPFKSEFEK